MLPILYATNSIALTVDFFVKPPTLDAIRLRDIGVFEAKTAARYVPPNRP